VTGRRLLVWRGLEEWLAESAEVQLGERRLTAAGTQLGEEPHPYQLDYELTTGDDWITESLVLGARDSAGERRLELRREPDGRWTANGEAVAAVDGALDCDLQFSPLTNAMPILRERLVDGGEPTEYLMAWVSVPDLSVTPSPQRYEPVDARHVRFVSLDSDFKADLELDEDGLVVCYPGLAERVKTQGTVP
jgi:uncharacterized protein